MSRGRRVRKINDARVEDVVTRTLASTPQSSTPP